MGLEEASFHGLRKGSWTEEEDELLRQCVYKFGLGEWHLVPLRAGLKRCRKSCRLRWVNYLDPNIKRGEFTEDEIDMIIRLHKLLGNRWTLIAGRLAGRTANDVKNYWNTHMVRKTKTRTSHVIKPRPQKISKDIISRRRDETEATDHNPIPHNSSEERCMPLVSPQDDTVCWDKMAVEEGMLNPSSWSREGGKGWNDEISFDFDFWNYIICDDQE